MSRYASGCFISQLYTQRSQELIAGAWIEPRDRSSMETPLQAAGAAKDDLGNGTGWADMPYFNDMVMLDDAFTSPSGVFDASGGFKVPAVSGFPRIY